MICPNITSPEWKALVNKIGENAAWKEFLIYGKIPNADNYEADGSDQAAVFRSIRTKSTEEIAKGVDPKLIRTQNDLKYTNYITASFIDTLGDISPNKKLDIKPSEAFQKVKNKYFAVVDNLKTALNGIVSSDQDLKEIKDSADYQEILKIFPVLDYVESYDEMVKAADTYQTIIDKFDSYKDMVVAELARKGIRMTKNGVKSVDAKEVDIQETDDTEDDDISQEEKGDRYDRNIMETNPRDTASVRVKFFVQSIQTDRFEFGVPIYADPNDVFSDLMIVGSQMDISKFNQAKDKYKYKAFRAGLAELAKARPYLHDVLDKLDRYKTTKQWDKINEILTFATKGFANETLVLFEARRDGNEVTGITKVKNIYTNNDTVENQVSRAWLERHKQSGFFNRSALNELTPNPEKLAQLGKIIEEGAAANNEKEKIAKFKEYFALLGIDFTDQDLDYIIPSLPKVLGKGKSINQIFAKNNLLDKIYTSFVKYSSSPFDDNYGFQDEKSSMKKLAGLYYNANPGAFQISSARTADGKQKYLYIPTSFIETKKREWMNGDTSAANSALAAPNKAFWDKVKNGTYTFAPGYFSGLREQKAGKQGKVRKNFTEKEQAVTMLLKHQENLQTGSYINFTLSDKTTTVETKMSKEFFQDASGQELGKGKDFSVNEAGEIEYTPGLKSRMYNAFAEPEINRILATIKYGANVNVENFETAGRLFYVVPALNSDPSLEEFRKDLYSGEMTLDQLKAKHGEAVSDVLLKTMMESTEAQIDKFLKNGIIKQQKDGQFLFPTSINGFKSTDYINRLRETKLKGRNSARLFLMDMKLNYYNTQVKMIQFLQFDPAVAFKSAKGIDLAKGFDQLTGAEKVKLASNTWDEFSKRAAALIAPGAQGNYAWEMSNGKPYFVPEYKTVTLKDVEYDINGKENTTTDAEEFVTVQEHIDTLMSEGKIPLSIWESIHNKIQKEGPGGFYMLDDEEMKYVFTPTKPVHVNNVEVAPGLSRIDYVKSSRYPLIPQHEAGSERDKLRQWMEKNDIRSVNFASGKKLGRPKESLTVFTDNGKTFVEPTAEQVASSMQVLNRDGLRTQQEIPEQKQYIRTVSQMNRTIFDGMLKETFSLAGIKEMTGNQAKSLKERVRARLFDIEAANLRKELGDLSKSHRGLARRLRDQIINDTTGSYGENDLRAIEIDEKTGKFRYPLEFQFKAKKYQGLINSMINKNVMLKVEGSSFVQVSGVGAKYNFSSLAQGAKNDIIWTSSYAKNFKNGNASLNYITKVGDEVKPAQVIVSQYIRDTQGNLIDLSKYITEKKGVKILDVTKFPKEVFELVGTRIPNQSFPSMLPIEVVGFLPSYMENTIIVPDGITGQMGSDFDVDKLYTYFPKFKYADNIVERLGANEEEYNELVEAAKKKAEAAGVVADEKGRYADFNTYLGEAVADKYGDKEVPKYKVEKPGTFDLVKYKLNKFSDVDTMDQDQLEQLYRDLHWMVLTHPAAYDKITASIDMPEVKKKIADREKMLAKYEIPSDKSAALPLDFMTSIQRFNDNRSGKVGVGVFANLISAQADFQDKVLKLGKIGEKGQEKPKPVSIRLTKNGKIVNLLFIGQTGSSTSFLNERRSVSDNLNIMFTESVDNAKNQYLREFNWEEKAMSAVGILEMLTDENGVAVPIEFAMDLTSQQIIKDLFERMEQKQDSFGEFDLNAIGTATTELIREKADKLYKDGYFPDADKALDYLTDDKRDQALDPVTLKNMWLVSQAITLPETEKNQALEKIAKDLNYKSVRDMMLEYETVQYDALKLFERLEDMGRELNTILGSVYTYTKGIGPSVFATKQKLNQLNKMSGSSNFLYLEKVAGKVDKDDVTGNISINPVGEIGSSIDNSLIVAQKIYKDLFPISSGMQIETVVDKLLDNMGRNKDQMGKDSYINTYETVFNGIKSYLYTIPDLELFVNPKDVRSQMINGDGSLGKRILNLTEEPEYKRNGFLKNLEIRQAPNQEAFTISFRAPFGTENDEKAIISGFYELATSDKEEVRQIAKDLAIYPFLTGDAGNIGRFIPPAYYMDDPEFSQAIGNMANKYMLHMQEDGAMNTLMTQIVQNNPEEFAKTFRFGTSDRGFGANDTPFKRILRKRINNAFELREVNKFSFTLGDFKEDPKGGNLEKALKIPVSDREAAELRAIGITGLQWKYPPFLLINDSFVSDFEGAGYRNVNYLYKRVSAIDDPVARYERINILGYNGIEEYEFNNPNLQSAVKNNNNVEDDPAFVADPAPVVKQNQVDTGTNDPSEYTNHSGGANGADSVWDTEGRKVGVVNHNHYYYGNKTPKGNVLLTKEQLEEGIVEMRKAAVVLGKNPQKAETVNLLARNWFQVKNSEQVIAISRISDDMKTVEGGTGWAVAMAQANNREIHVFNQKDNKWYTWNGDTFVQSEIPTLKKNFAGIGTRDLTEQGRQAITDVYEKTFATQPTEQTQTSTELLNKVGDTVNLVYAAKWKTVNLTFKIDSIEQTPNGYIVVLRGKSYKGASTYTVTIEDGKVVLAVRKGYNINMDFNKGEFDFKFGTAATQGIKTYTGKIETLEPNQVFVFGSNPEGRHGAGAAKLAHDKFGAMNNNGRGLQLTGKSYALVTKNLTPGYTEKRTGITYEKAGERSVSPEQIKANIQELYETAKRNPNKEFLVAYSATGKNLNGYSAQEMADMFSSTEIPSNMVFEEGFSKLLNNNNQEVVEDEEEAAPSIVTVPAGNFIVEEGEDGLLQMWYSKADGSKGAELKNKSIMTQVAINYGIQKNPNSKVTIKVGPNMISYYVAPDNTVYSLSPSTFGNEIVDPAVKQKALAQAELQEIFGADAFKEEEVKEEQPPVQENLTPGEKKVVVPEGSNPNNMVIFETQDAKYLMNDGQQEAYNFIKSNVQDLLKNRKRNVKVEDLDDTVTFTDPLTAKFNNVIPKDMWNNMMGLAGRGGVGKTTVIKAIIESIEGENRYSRPSVMYLAPTHTAATVLQESLGLDSEKANDGTVNTIASHVRKNQPVGNTLQLASEKDYVASQKFKPAFGQPDVIIIDESSMIGAGDIKDMVTRLKTDLNKGVITRMPILIFMGDYRQLGPINEQQNDFVNKGIISSTLLLNKEKTRELTQVMRNDDKQMHQVFDAVGNEIIDNIKRTQASQQPRTLSFDNYDRLTNKSTPNMLVVNNVNGVIEDYADYLKDNNNPYGMFWVHYNRVENPKTVQLASKIRKTYLERAGFEDNTTSYRRFTKGDYIEFTDSLEIKGHGVKYVPETQEMKALLEKAKVNQDKKKNYDVQAAIIKPRARFKVLDMVESQEFLVDILPSSISRHMADKQMKIEVENFLLYNRQNKIRGYRKVLGLKVNMGKYNSQSKQQEGITISKADGTVIAKFNMHYGDFKNNSEMLENLNSDKPMPFVPSYIGSSHTAQGNSIKNVIVGDYNVKENRANPSINQDDIFSSMYTGITRTSGTLVLIKPSGANIINNQDVYQGAITDDKKTQKPRAAVQPAAETEAEENNQGMFTPEPVEEIDPLQLFLQTQADESADVIVNEIFGSSDTTKDFKGVLNNIYSRANPLTKAVINAIVKSRGIAPVTFKIDSSIADMGQYNSSTKTITINPKEAMKGAVDNDDMRNKLYEVVLHELIHHVTVDLLTADPAKLNPEQRKWVMSVKNLFDKVQQDILDDAYHSEKLLLALSTSSEDNFMSSKDKSLYYGLTNVYDFVSMLMTDKGFQKFMNEREFSSEKTILDRFMDLLANLMKALGIQINDNSVLKEGMTNIMGLIGSRTEVKTNDDSIQKSVAVNATQQDYIERNFDTLLDILNIKTVC